MNKLRRCSCCGKMTDDGEVLCSSLGNLSFYYCKKCTETGQEPYNLLVECFANTRWNDILPYWQNVIKESCRLHCKTIEQFEQDCIDFMENCKHWSENPW